MLTTKVLFCVAPSSFVVCSYWGHFEYELFPPCCEVKSLPEFRWKLNMPCCLSIWAGLAWPGPAWPALMWLMLLNTPARGMCSFRNGEGREQFDQNDSAEVAQVRNKDKSLLNPLWRLLSLIALMMILFIGLSFSTKAYVVKGLFRIQIKAANHMPPALSCTAQRLTTVEGGCLYYLCQVSRFCSLGCEKELLKGLGYNK